MIIKMTSEASAQLIQILEKTVSPGITSLNISIGFKFDRVISGPWFLCMVTSFLVFVRYS